MAKDLDFYIPDSLDMIQDNVDGISLVNKKGNPLSSKDELVADKPVPRITTSCAYELSTQEVPKELIRGSQVHSDFLDTRPSITQTEPHISNCLLDDVSANGFVKESQFTDLGRHTGSENACIDFAGQDLASSMMTLLLPRAVPLLRKTYQRKRVRKYSQETSPIPDLDPNGSNSIGINDLRCRLRNLPIQSEHVALSVKGVERRLKRRETPLKTSSLFHEVTIECSSNGIIEEPIITSGKSGVESIIPDSFEDDQSAHDLVAPRPLCDSGEADQPPSRNTNNDLEAAQSCGNSKSGQEKADSKFGNDEGNVMSLLPNRSPHKGESLINDSPSAFLSLGKCIIPGKSHDACLNIHKNNLHNASSFPVGAAEDIPALESYGILHNDLHTLNAEVIHGVEGSLWYAQQNIFSKRSKSTGHLTEVNPSINCILSEIDERATDIRQDVCAPQASLDDKNVVSGIEDTSSLTVTANVLPSTGEQHAVFGVTGKQPFSLQSPSKFEVPLSESILCRNINNGEILETSHSDKSFTRDNRQAEIVSSGSNQNASFYDEKQQCLKTSNEISESVGVLFNVAPTASQNQEAVKHVSTDADGFNSIHTCTSNVEKDHVNSVNNLNNLAASEECHYRVPLFQELTKYSPDQNQKGALIYSVENPPVKSIASNDHTDHPPKLNEGKRRVGSFSKDMDPSEEFEDFVEFIGCYLHPNPVLSVWLISREGALHVCALCGCLEGGGRDLFIYKVTVKGQEINSPSFLGYTPISFPLLNDAYNRTIPVERSGLQFTPDGQYIVFLNCIKAPCCREKNLSCLCSICELDCCEENAVKVVHVELGYVTIVAKLKAVGRIYCVLVCEPNHLLAVEEGGELHVWIMNPMWRVILEEFVLPSFESSDHMSPSLIELKPLPRCGYLIVGHNGVGGFCLWDVSKRVLLSKFSSPGNTIFQALPVGLFRFPWEDAFATVTRVDDHVKELLAAADSWHVQSSKNDLSLPSTGKDTAVWLLVSVTNLEDQDDHLMKELETGSVGWRLALLAKDMVFVGSVLDPRAASVSALSHYGITGTSDGCVYIWELTNGNKLVDLHHFNGESISSIAADAKSGAFAVASNSCQLRIYTLS